MHNIHWLCAGANMVRFRLHWRTYASYIDIVGSNALQRSSVIFISKCHYQSALFFSPLSPSQIQRQIKNTFLIANKANIFLPSGLDEHKFLPHVLSSILLEVFDMFY